MADEDVVGDNAVAGVFDLRVPHALNKEEFEFFNVITANKELGDVIFEGADAEESKKMKALMLKEDMKPLQQAAKMLFSGPANKRAALRRQYGGGSAGLKKLAAAIRAGSAKVIQDKQIDAISREIVEEQEKAIVEDI